MEVQVLEGVGSKNTGMFGNGLANPETCIFYPLSPRIAVAIYSSQGFLGVAADEYDGRSVLLDGLKYIISRNIKIMAQEDPFMKSIGEYMTYIPLFIIVLQILMGIAVKIVGHFKK